MKGASVVRRSFFAAVCVFTAALNGAHGQTELYAGPSENRFSLLRDDASTTGYEFGGRCGLLSWFALDFGFDDFGRVNGAFPVVTANPPEVTVAVYTPTTGTNSLHVEACEVCLIPEVRCSFGSLVSGSLGFGLARCEAKIGSNDFYQLPVIAPVGGSAPPPTWVPEYSGTSRSWTGLGRASLKAAVSRSWTAEVSAHFTSASAINAGYDLGGDIGNRRLQVFGAALDVIWRIPAK
jgi:hypothetical protein